jgi:transcriptional regulator with XRE-family HTH domain
LDVWGWLTYERQTVLSPVVTATVEAAVHDNWAAVAEAIRSRVTELGITQAQLAARSGVSESTIRQLMKNYGPRRRNRHTLEDTSKGLDWPADYLSRILDGGDAGRLSGSGDPMRAEIDELRSRVADLTSRMEALEHGQRPD